jgi:N-acetylneuraminate synthase
VSAVITIGGRRVGAGQAVYVVAEMSANHGGSYERALRLVEVAKEVGADAVKLQTYTADTLTLDSDAEAFRVGGGTLWDGRTLHDLYREAHTPWEWQPRLKVRADQIGIDLFSSPFDATAVEFLERMAVPAHKIASFEIVDLDLIRRVARTGKPVILSTGMASHAEIEEAVRVAREAGAGGVALLKCTSAYPAPPEEMNLRAIPALAEEFDVPVGLSDHTLGTAVPVAAVALGACIVEKHLTLSRADGGPDSAFSLEPGEFRTMVEGIRTAEQALGSARHGIGAAEARSRSFRRSLFVVRDVRRGEVFTADNVRSIRPAGGLPPREIGHVLGRHASRDLARGTPMSADMVADSDGESSGSAD